MSNIVPSSPGVYRIVNTSNGHIYIGSTNCLSRRWPEHRRKLRSGISTCSRLQAAWRKYGESAFIVEVLEIANSTELLISLEQAWMDRLSPEYNVAKFAGSQVGICHSDETRALLSRIAKPISAEHRAKMVAGIRNMSPVAKSAMRAKQSAARIGNKNALGYRHTEESNRKRSASLKGRVFSAEHREKLRLNHWSRGTCA